jgi:hypothetical protein
VVCVLEAEQTVEALVSALCHAGQALSEQRVALMSLEGWSSVTSTLEIKEWRDPDGNRLAFYGYLDGERAGVGQVGWIVDVTRDGEGWLVERTLNVNKDLTDLQTVAEFPPRSCRDSSELAHSLVLLVRELLALPAPES